MKRISKPPAERKQEILEAALQLFSEKGYENTTIQDIAADIGVAQGLCYRYFKSKQEIFAAAAALHASKSIDNLKITANKSDNPAISLSDIFAKLLQYTVLYSQFEAEHKCSPEMNTSRLDKLAGSLVELIIPIVEEGRSRGIFKCEDTKTTATFLVFGIVHVIHYKIPPENIRPYILSHKKNIIHLCERVLGISPGYKIGIGWDRYLT